MKKSVTGPFLAVGLFAACAVNAIEPDAKVALCKGCSASAFGNIAEAAAIFFTPRLEEGRQFVFVVDVGSDEIRYYEVTRENDESNWEVFSTQRAAPAAAVAELRTAQQEIQQFVAEVQDFDLTELDLGVIPIDSATDLIGDSSISHDTAFLRGALQNAVADNYFNSWTNIVGAVLGDLAERFANTLIANPSILTLNSTTVHFPDGTSVELEITAIVRDELGRFKTVRLEVNVASVQGPGLDPIPTTPGAFLTALANGIAGDPAYLSNLSDLFVRGGGRIDRSPSGDSCNAFMQCRDAGVDAKGNPLIECRLVLPKEELRC